MKKFQFRLQKLLDVRIAQEKEIEIELAKPVGQQNILRNKQDEYKAKVEAQKKEHHDKMVKGATNINELMMFHRFSDFADKVVRDTQTEIDSLNPVIAEIKVRLEKATKDRKVIEKLKEKRYDEWKYEYQKAIDNENDDMNQKIFVRKHINSEEV